MSAMYCTLCWKVGMMFWWMPVKVSDRSIDQVSYFINRISQVHFMWKQHLSVCGVVWWGGVGGILAFVLLYTADVCGSFHGFFLKIDESNWSLQRIVWISCWQKVFTEWMLSSLKTRLNAAYLHYQSISLMFEMPPPTEINKTNSPIILC